MTISVFGKQEMSQSNSPGMTDTVRISAGRFEQSPYFEFYANPNTRLGVAANRYFAADNGEDPVGTYWTLRQKAVLFDVPEKPWQIEGPGAVPFLEQIFARPVATLVERRGRYAIGCTCDGGIFMDGILFKLAENRYWYVQPDGALEEWPAAHKGEYDVKISDPASRVLKIQGPNSMKIMPDASNGAIDDQMKYFNSGYYDLGGQRLYVSRTSWTGELECEIYSDGANTEYQRLWGHLFKAGAPHNMVFGSLSAMGIRRIEAGILDNLSDIGKAALFDADRRPLLYGLKCASATPDSQGEIMNNGICVGRVTV